MPSIEERPRKDGTTGYKAEVVVRINGQRKKRSATFDKRSTAVAWAKKKEKQLKDGDTASIMEKPSDPKTVADAIDKYMCSFRGDLKSTKKQVISFVRDGRCEFSDVYLKDISAHDVRAFAEELANGGRGPATVTSYLVHVCHVLSVAEDDFGPSYHVSLDALDRGKRSARRNKISGKPGVRNRRPDIQELDLLMTYFMKRFEGDRRSVPMHLIIPFAIFGCRRQSEITGLRWVDIDGDKIKVRGTKHPRKPEGVDIDATITDEAGCVIQLHGKQHPTLIFPYHPGTISRLFTNACKLLDIKDLHFHDLRHEGVSWLREKGWSVSHVMMVSGHSSTQTLDRYTGMKQLGDKYESWTWLDRLEKLSELSA